MSRASCQMVFRVHVGLLLLLLLPLLLLIYLSLA